MFDFIIREFLDEIMGMCLDSEIESDEIPGVIMEMILKVGDDGDVEKIFDEVTKECCISRYENTVNQLLTYEVVYNNMCDHLDEELSNVARRYQDAGYSNEEAKDKALNTDYIKHLNSVKRVLAKIVKEFNEEDEGL